MTSPGRKLRDLIARPGLIESIGSNDAVSARLVELAGFECVYASGAAACHSDYGMPDVGLITMTEMIEHTARLVAACSVPVIADLDDGGGNPVRVFRSVQLAERTGIAGFHIEDTDISQGKHFVGGGGGGTQPLDLDRDTFRPASEFVQFVKAACDARSDEDVVIMARTDVGLHSIEEAIERAGRYTEAGADMVFLHWIPLDEIGRVIAAVDKPLVFMAHDVTAQELDQMEQAGVKIFVRPTFTWSVAFGALTSALEELKANREITDFWGRRGAPENRLKALDSYGWAARAKQYGMGDGS